MPWLIKRVVDALQKKEGGDAFLLDSELRGFGVRMKPSGTKTFVIQYRNAERRIKRFVIGQYGVLSVEVARDIAKKKLASVVDGRDLVLSRICAALSARLGHLAFEGQGAFSSQC